MDGSFVPLGKPRSERADAVRNRELLLSTAREMLAEGGAEKITMDALAERAGLGKGTVFRRFGTRAGIFSALMDDDEHHFQEQVLRGPPPLGPGADPRARMHAYGRARIAFLIDHLAISRAALDSSGPAPAGASSTSIVHLRVLLNLGSIDVPNRNVLATQLTAALEAPLLLYMAAPASAPATAGPGLAEGWEALVDRLFGGR